MTTIAPSASSRVVDGADWDTPAFHPAPRDLSNPQPKELLGARRACVPPHRFQRETSWPESNSHRSQHAFLTRSQIESTTWRMRSEIATIVPDALATCHLPWGNPLPLGALERSEESIAKGSDRAVSNDALARSGRLEQRAENLRTEGIAQTSRLSGHPHLPRAGSSTQ